ncbi:MAG: hypothetical protein P8X73_17970 [Ignavibacteriaceae bacterium]
MKKSRDNKKIRDSFYEDTFSYLNFDLSDGLAQYEGEIDMNNFLEDHNIEDLDISELNDSDIDDILSNQP